MLDLVTEYYFPLKLELIPCIPGLIVSILPGLEERDAELEKKVLYTLDKAGECVGRKYLIGAIWMVNI